MTSRSKPMSDADKVRLVSDRSVDIIRSVIRGMAAAYEGSGVACVCTDLHPVNAVKTVTGHAHGCYITQAVRTDLAKAGIL